MSGVRCQKILQRLLSSEQIGLSRYLGYQGHYLCSTRDKVAARLFSSSARCSMRFVQFTCAEGGPQRLGVQLGAGEGDVIDISGVDPSVPNSLVKLLQRGPALLEKAKRIVAEGKSVHSFSDIRLLPPVSGPDKVVCVGLNYREHCEEQNRPIPTEPVFFSKFSSTIVGPADSVIYPQEITKCLDWEVELAIVIGKSGKNIRPTSAMEHVFGFTGAQDITARDWQKGHNGGQWLLGKSMDTFCPLGPCVVVKEALPHPQALGLRCWVNGELKQDGSTSNMVFNIDYIVAYLSNFVTLLPGDVILTGTPSGVGVFRNPPQFLKRGDVVESEVEGIGRLKNSIV